MALSLDDIHTLFDRHGDIAHSGGPVTQCEHVLKQLHWPKRPASDTLIIAALRRDLGHLLKPQGDASTVRGIDDQHYHECLSADSVRSLALQGGRCPPTRPTPFCTTLTPPMCCACAAGTISPR